MNEYGNRRISYETADRLAAQFLGDTGKSENDKYILEEGDVVVLDLFTNALLVPASPSAAKTSGRPLSTKMVVDGREINALHTVTRTKDRSGKHFKFAVIHKNDVQDLCELVVSFATFISKQTKALVIILGPFPRFPLPFYNDKEHNLANNDTWESLMRQVRDINFFVGVSDQANTIRKDELLLSLPYDVIVAGLSRIWLCQGRQG